MSMMKYVREFRLIPVVLLATASLAALKLLGLLLDGGYLLTDLDPATVDRPVRVESDAGGAAPVDAAAILGAGDVRVPGNHRLGGGRSPSRTQCRAQCGAHRCFARAR